MTDVETPEQSNQPSRARGGARAGARGGTRGGGRGGAYREAYDGARRGAYDGARGGASEGARGGAYGGARRGAYRGANDGARGGAYDGGRGGAYRGSRGRARGGGASATWESYDNRAGKRKANRAKVADDSLPDSMRCIVCMLNPREIILVPCNHVCLCEDCAEIIGTVCPFCNKNIQRKMVAYLP